MKLSLILSILFLQLIVLQVWANDSDVIDAAKCAQDIVDYKYGGPEGVAFAASIVDDVQSGRESAINVLERCASFLKTSPRWKMSRYRQLEVLRSLRETMTDRGYFFLRGAARPLIVCVKQNSFRSTCQSATGKSWLETGSHLQSNGSFKIYRLGHSEKIGGVLVVGPQDEFSDEDREYVHSLPSEFAGSALTDLTRELTIGYVRLKFWKLTPSTVFLKHYFLKP